MSFKINALATNNESIYLGDQSGRILLLNHEYKVIDSKFDHRGSIVALNARGNILASLSMDRTVRLWKCENEQLYPLHSFSIRDIAPENSNEMFPALRSESQALFLHPTKDLLATRNGQGDLLILSWDDSGFKMESCLRVHETYDIATCRFIGESDDILCGTVRGHIIWVRNKSIYRLWEIGSETHHWFEPIDNENYLVASDQRNVIKINVQSETVQQGQVFARDDFEHICRTPSGNVYAASFDRNIYEIGNDLNAKKIIATLPFKLRWLRPAPKKENTLLVQCRDGGLYEVNQETGDYRVVYKKTSPCIWTAAINSLGEMVLAGNGPNLVKFNHKNLSWTQQITNVRDFSESIYTKRIAINESGSIALGRIDGQLCIEQQNKIPITFELKSGIRDLQFNQKGNRVYTCHEDGAVYESCLETVTVRKIYQSEYPLRSLALNQDSQVIAIGERLGKLVLVDTPSMNVLKKIDLNRTAKRMKWEGSVLYYNHAASLCAYDMVKDEAKILTKDIGNTIEDFSLSPCGKYVAAIAYTRELILFSTDNWTIINRVIDDKDYSKGLAWLPGERLELVTFGRSGTLNLYEIYEEMFFKKGSLENVSNCFI